MVEIYSAQAWVVINLLSIAAWIVIVWQAGSNPIVAALSIVAISFAIASVLIEISIVDESIFSGQ